MFGVKLRFVNYKGINVYTTDD